MRKLSRTDVQMPAAPKGESFDLITPPFTKVPFDVMTGAIDVISARCLA